MLQSLIQIAIDLINYGEKEEGMLFFFLARRGRDAGHQKNKQVHESGK